MTNKLKKKLIKPKYSIMLVDDDPFTRETISIFLNERGFNISAFENPVSAVEYYKDNFPAIHFVLIDYLMPQMNGYDCFQLLKTINPEIKAFFMSGFAGDNLHQLISNETNLLGYIQKPFNFRLLAKTIRDMVEQKKYDKKHLMKW